MSPGGNCWDHYPGILTLVKSLQFVGNVLLMSPLLELPPLSYLLIKHCHSSEDRAPVDIINVCSIFTLQWRYNKRDGVSNHWRLNCLLNHLFKRRSKKTSKLRVTGLCEGNSLVTGEFPAQKASNAEMFPFDDVIMKRVTEASFQWPVSNAYRHSISKWPTMNSTIYSREVFAWLTSQFEVIMPDELIKNTLSLTYYVDIPHMRFSVPEAGISGRNK